MEIKKFVTMTVDSIRLIILLAFSAIALLILVLNMTILGKTKNSKLEDGKLVIPTTTPLALIKGSKLDGRSIFTPENIADFQDFSLVIINKYSSISIVRNDTDSTEKNRTDNISAQYIDAARKNIAKWTYNDINEEYVMSDNFYKQLFFKKHNGKLDLVRYGSSNAKALHYSLNHKKNAFTILAQSEDQNGVIELRSFLYLKREELNNLVKGSENDKFLVNNIKLPLKDKKINLSLCGEFSQKEVHVFEQSIKDWQLHEIGLEIQIVKPKEYPPFSDLNVNCIVPFNGYKVVSFVLDEAPGFVPGWVDLRQGNTILSSIFINTDYSYFGTEFEATFKHELGHFLGLGHDFNPNSTSIMSYNKVKFISKIDLERLKSLYSVEPEVINQKFPSKNVV
ncbi:MAG: hypothetical protein HRT70_08855 [Flavobacteriaceae bacterium]|nr:hypothetical protein [Flavobacteriaceae bacterium]